MIPHLVWSLLLNITTDHFPMTSFFQHYTKNLRCLSYLLFDCADALTTEDVFFSEYFWVQCTPYLAFISGLQSDLFFLHVALSAWVWLIILLPGFFIYLNHLLHHLRGPTMNLKMPKTSQQTSDLDMLNFFLLNCLHCRSLSDFYDTA